MGVRNPKRRRIQAQLKGSQASHLDEEDSDTASQSSLDDLQRSPGELNTPLTPLSPGISPRYPSDLKKFNCTFQDCTKAFNRPAKLEQHVRSHTNTRPFVCSYPPCTKDFLRASHLKQHIKSAHTTVREYSCSWEDCTRKFSTGTRLRRHQAVHEGRERHKCTIDDCGISFRKQNTLQAHILKFHEGVKPFQCGFLDEDGHRCGAGFDTAHKLRDHEGRLHNTKRHVCSLCPSSTQGGSAGTPDEQSCVAFATFAALQRHIASDHPPTCADCGLQCLSQAALRSHAEVYHSGLNLDQRRTHICPKDGCAASFTKKSNLNIHLRTIHEGKRYICEVSAADNEEALKPWDGAGACGASFSSKARMVEHVRAFHLGLTTKPVSATKKRRGFRKRPSVIETLTAPQQSVQTAMELDCPELGCEWSFLRHNDLEQHLKTTHEASDEDTRNYMMSLITRPSLAAAPLISRGYTETRNQNSFSNDIDAPDEPSSSPYFWDGDYNDPDWELDEFRDPWLNDEMEMRRLIDEA